MNILADASLPGLNAAFPAPFNITTYITAAEVPALLPGQDVLLCRSTLKVNSTLLSNNQLQYVATASSGTDHLDKHFLKSNHIQIIDAKGCNAVSVADYVVSSLAYLVQKNLLKGDTAGIIGMGKVGAKVYDRLKNLGFKLYVYDPLKSLKDSQFESCSLSDLAQCDLLCIHAELHNTQPHPSVNLIDHHFLAQLKPDCVLINAARGGIINEQDLLNTKKNLVYCTDVYLNEPAIDERIINKATLCTPHIAGHSLEAKYAAVSLVSEQLHQSIGLPIPQYVRPNLSMSFELSTYPSWQEIALSLYNPVQETLILKNAPDKRSGFLSLRELHQKHHDFRRYYEVLAKPLPMVFADS